MALCIAFQSINRNMSPAIVRTRLGFVTVISYEALPNRYVMIE